MNKNPSGNQSIRNMNIPNNSRMNMKPNNTQRQNVYAPANIIRSGYSGSNVFGIVLLVVVILLVAAACYWAYTVYSSRTFETSINVVALADVKNASSQFSIGSGTIPNSSYSNEYSISMWLNITDYTYNYGKEKTVLRRGDAGSGNPEIVLGDKNNDLIVRLKLQGPAPTSSFVVSKFENIPNNVKQQQPTQQTHRYDVNEPEDTGYIHGAFDLHGTTTKLMPCNNTVFNKISGNNIDYPTIHYDIATGCDNAPTNADMKPADAMTIMLEQSMRMKEGFKCGSYKGDQQSLGRVDISKLQDNSAPFESQVIHNNFFSLVSGNNVVSCPKLRFENFGKENFGKEKFYNTGDIVNAMVAVLTDLCNLAKAMQSQSNADDQVNSMNTGFQQIIDALEQTRTSAKTSTDVETAFNSAMDKLPALLSPNNTITQYITQLQTDLATMKSITSTDTSDATDLSALQSAVNSKLAANNCSITLSGSTEIDNNINLFETLINLTKQSLYAYINNMGYGIQKAYPNLSSSQNISCLLDSSINKDPTVGTCVYKMLPLQKWVNVIVSVYNQVVDIYVDGQLGSSCVLKGYPAISTADVNLTPDGGFSGQMSNVVFSNTAMTATKARQLYYAGPVPSTGLFSMIPNWVWYLIIFIIVGAILYSVLM